MKLYYSALSPFCRKIRMALDHKGLDYEVEDDPHVEDCGHLNPRAEIPMLEDGELRIVNSSVRSYDVQACTMREVKSWRFPRPVGGEAVVNYPFIFKPTY